VTIKGEDLKDEPRSIPCTRISWRMSGEPSWSQLAENPASLVVVPVGERRNICLDFKYDVLWEDPVGEYTAPVTVSFLPRAEAVLSKAAPNPFSPNGDGIKDETVIACDLTWEQDEPEAIQCILALADDGSSETIKTLEIPGVHSPGTARVTWTERMRADVRFRMAIIDIVSIRQGKVQGLAADCCCGHNTARSYSVFTKGRRRSHVKHYGIRADRI